MTRTPSDMCSRCCRDCVSEQSSSTFFDYNYLGENMKSICAEEIIEKIAETIRNACRGPIPPTEVEVWRGVCNVLKHRDLDNLEARARAAGRQIRVRQVMQIRYRREARRLLAEWPEAEVAWGGPVTAEMIAHEIGECARGYQFVVPTHTVWKRVVSTLKARPPKLKGYCHIVARNLLSDLDDQDEVCERWRERARRVAVKWLLELWLKEEIEQARAKVRGEFEEFVPTIEVKARQRNTALKQFKVVRMRVIEGMSDADVAHSFPETTPAQRWQWKSRGIKRILAAGPPSHLAWVLKQALSPVRSAGAKKRKKVG